MQEVADNYKREKSGKYDKQALSHINLNLKGIAFTLQAFIDSLAYQFLSIGSAFDQNHSIMRAVSMMPKIFVMAPFLTRDRLQEVLL